MRHLRALTACLVAVLNVPVVSAAPPSRPKPLRGAETTADGIVIRGRQPAARVAWLAVVRERVHDHIEVRAEPGFGVADVDGAIHVTSPPAPGRRVVWAVADLDASEAVRFATNVEPSSDSLQVTVEAGASTVSIAAAEVHVLYTRSQGRAWTGVAHDGGSLDRDDAVNGEIVIALETLRPVHGNMRPPETTAAGDMILVVHPRSLRGAEVIVP